MAETMTTGAPPAMHGVRAFLSLAAMWVRVSLTYRTSFALLLVSSLLITGLDFVAILVMFANVDVLGGFGLPEIAFLYGATSMAIGLADLVVGNVERLGTRIRTGSLDAMMVRPVSRTSSRCAGPAASSRPSPSSAGPWRMSTSPGTPPGW